MFAWEFCIEKGRGFLVNFFWSPSPTKRSTKSPRKIRGKFGAKFGAKFGTKIRKIRETFVLPLSRPKGMGCQGTKNAQINFIQGLQRETPNNRVFVLLRAESPQLEMAKLLQKPVFTRPGCRQVTVRRRTNVQQLSCNIDLSCSFYYLFFSFVLIEFKPFVLEGKVMGENF